jgi:hypothetical protein
MLVTKPRPIGSVTPVNTIGMVVVCSRTATTAGGPLVRMTSGAKSTSFLA